MKTGYLQKVPWAFSGLAHTDENVAREMAMKILQQWEMDPRPQAHHRLTARLMGQENFIGPLRSFKDGASLDSLCLEFQQQVACWRLVPIVETTIEAKHARVSLAKRRHHLGPVRISLANRLPLLTRWVQRGHVDSVELVRLFSKSRSLKKIPGLLDIADHPDLDAAQFRKGPASMRVLLGKLIYRCNIRDMYHSYEVAGKANERSKRAAAKAQAKLIPSNSSALTYDRVVLCAMQQHMLQNHEASATTCYYSAPRQCMQLQSVEAVLEEPSTKRQRVDALPDDADSGLAPDVGMWVPDTQPVTFQILLKNPGDKKVIRPAVGVGGRLAKGAVVAVHKGICCQDACLSDSIVVAGSASASDVSGQFLLSNLAGTIEELQASMKAWKSQKLVWTLNAEDVGFELDEVDSLLQGMVAAGAFEGNTEGLGFSALPAQRPLLESLQRLGLVLCAGEQDLRWRLSEVGTRALSSCCRLSAPVNVFHVPDNLKIADATVYEVIMLLQANGWVWQAWVPVSKRTRRMALQGRTFDDYARGKQKIWYSGEVPSLPYLRVLWDAEKIFDLGLPAIPHGREDACYKALLRGEVDEELARGAILPPDVDAIPDRESDDDAVLRALEQLENDPEPDEDLPDIERELVEAFELLENGATSAEEEQPASPARPAGPEIGDLGDRRVDEVPPAEPVAVHRGPRDGVANPRPKRAAAPAGEGPQLEGGFFGIFRITAKKAGTVGGGAHGGYQATCLFHKKNDKTGCKRFLSCESSNESDRQMTLRRLMWWCTLAQQHSTQRNHLSVPLPTETCPPLAVLEAQCSLIERPEPASIKTDVEIAAAAARHAAAKARPKQSAARPASASAKAAREAVAKSKAKAKGKSKAKSQPKAKASASADADPGSDEAASDPPTSEEADSDSASSSSSSSGSSSSSSS